jgi:hypothetical protein
MVNICFAMLGFHECLTLFDRTLRGLSRANENCSSSRIRSRNTPSRSAHLLWKKTHQSDNVKKLYNIDDDRKQNFQTLQSLSIAGIAHAREVAAI